MRKAADLGWSVSSLDVRQAFLNAPRLEQPGHVTLVDPPALLHKMGITKKNEVWQVRGALYGLCETSQPGSQPLGVREEGYWMDTFGGFGMMLIKPLWGTSVYTLTI